MKLRYFLGIFVIAALLFIATDSSVNNTQFVRFESDITSKTFTKLTDSTKNIKSNNLRKKLTLTVIGNGYTKSYSCKASSLMNGCDVELQDLTKKVPGFVGYTNILFGTESTIEPGTYSLHANETIYVVSE